MYFKTNKAARIYITIVTSLKRPLGTFTATLRNVVSPAGISTFTECLVGSKPSKDNNLFIALRQSYIKFGRLLSNPLII